MEGTMNGLSPVKLRARYGIYAALILKTFDGMRQGCLVITMPDGQQLSYGSPDAALKAHIHVLKIDFFRKCVLYGDIGFGEAYMDGDWITDSITNVIRWFLLNIESAPTLSGSRRKFTAANILKVLNRFYHRTKNNTLRLSQRNIHDHYDLSNDFFRTFLDPSMTYSSAYFPSPGLTLESAQREKYDRLCRQLKLKPTDHVLEIGSGWGGFAMHAARNYGCRITTVTISQEQFKLAQERIAEAGLSDRVAIALKDYRNLRGQFDKIVSIEMLEAVGHNYLKTYFTKIDQLLKRDGLLGIQVIISPDARYNQLRKSVDWIQKHIFPGSLLPSVGAIHHAVHATGELSLVDLKNFGGDYAKTLSVWRDNFNSKLDRVKQLGFDDAFVRKWNYYLSYCEAAFDMRNISVVQMVFSRPNNLNV